MSNKNIISVLILVILIGLLIISYLKVATIKPEEFFDSHKGLEKSIADTLIKKITKGLDTYKNDYGHYPITKSKYFMDSLDEIENIPLVYIYKDTLISGKVVSIKFQGGKYSNTFVGIGHKDVIIKYISTDGISFKLYR